MRFIIYAAMFVVALYALIDCIATPARSVRSLPKAVWLLVIVLLPGVGGLAWLFVGRALREGSGGFLSRGSTPTAPDDDPDFLRQLGDQTWSQKMKRKRERPIDPTTDEPGAGPAAAAG
jgi:hypothetical protein